MSTDTLPTGDIRDTRLADAISERYLSYALSIIMSAGLGASGVQRYLTNGSRGGLGLGVLFFLTGAVLLVYGIRVWKKMKELRV